MTPMPACQCFQCGFFVFLLCWLPYGGRCGATPISCKQTRVTTLPQLVFQQINRMMYKVQATSNLGREEPRADQNGSLAPTFTQSMTFNLFDPNQTHLGPTLTRSTRAMRQRYPTISTLIVFFWRGRVSLRFVSLRPFRVHLRFCSIFHLDKINLEFFLRFSVFRAKHATQQSTYEKERETKQHKGK
jgi:hypothetical protein